MSSTTAAGKAFKSALLPPIHTTAFIASLCAISHCYARYRIVPPPGTRSSPATQLQRCAPVCNRKRHLAERQQDRVLRTHRSHFIICDERHRGSIGLPSSHDCTAHTAGFLSSLKCSSAARDHTADIAAAVLGSAPAPCGYAREEP